MHVSTIVERVFRRSHQSGLRAGRVIEGRSRVYLSPIIFFFSIKTLIFPVRFVLFLNTPTSPLKSLALAGRNSTKLTQTLKWAAHPRPSPSIPIITAYSTDPPSLHHLCTQTNVQMHSLALFLEFVFKFDIFFEAAGKRSHENFSSGSYGGVEEEEQSLQQRFKAASLSFSSVSSRKKMKPNEPKIRIPKTSGPVEEE
ncbi:hypothetical protein ACFX2I_040534 [Malus domestica]